jgi:3-hydroxyisobutyrate dehydrogenase-like beta-hydroxyacid dehydrogenase
VAHGETPADRHVLAGRAAETVAVLGVGGTMGFAMARKIAQAGIPVRAWNRTRAKYGDEDVSATYLSSAPEHAA